MVVTIRCRCGDWSACPLGHSRFVALEQSAPRCVRVLNPDVLERQIDQFDSHVTVDTETASSSASGGNVVIYGGASPRLRPPPPQQQQQQRLADHRGVRGDAR